jgi:osmotically-inducible protein OsmY
MKNMKMTMSVMAAAALVLMLGGCHKEGPGERAGKAADSAMDKVGQKIEKAGEAVQDAAKGDKK